MNGDGKNTSPVLGYRPLISCPNFISVKVSVSPASTSGEEGVGQNSSVAIKRVPIIMGTTEEKDLNVGFTSLFTGQLSESKRGFLRPHFERSRQLASLRIHLQVGRRPPKGPTNIGTGPSFTLNVEASHSEMAAVTVARSADVGNTTSRPSNEVSRILIHQTSHLNLG